MIKALIFDFDGLILDTETPWITAWKSLYTEYGFDYPMESWSQTVGGWGASTFDPGAALYNMSPASIDLEELRARQLEHSNALILLEPVLPGVEEYLHDAAELGLRLAIASSSEREWVETHLDRLGLLSCFEKIICGEDVPSGRTKPHADLFVKALAELQLEPSEAVALEDSPNGVKAARDAGILVVAVPNASTAQLPMEGANITLTSLKDLPLRELLRRISE